MPQVRNASMRESVNFDKTNFDGQKVITSKLKPANCLGKVKMICDPLTTLTVYEMVNAENTEFLKKNLIKVTMTAIDLCRNTESNGRSSDLAQ